MSTSVYDKSVKVSVSSELLKHVGDNRFRFTINGVTGSVAIHEGSQLSNRTIRHIQEARRTYRIWSLPQFESDIVTLDDHDLSQNGWHSFHVLTEYGGKKHTVSAYLPRHKDRQKSATTHYKLPLEFRIWKYTNRSSGDACTLWQKFSQMCEKNQVQPHNNYLILHRLAISRSDSQENSLYAKQVCFAVSQLAIEKKLSGHHYEWVVSQQREELKDNLCIDSIKPLFTSATDTLGTGSEDNLVLDQENQTLRMLRKRYPGYWCNHTSLSRFLKKYSDNKKFLPAFNEIWNEMKRNGVPLSSGSELRQLTRPLNLKYLAHGFAENSDLFERCNIEVAPGPFCSITRRSDWIGSCTELLSAAETR